MTTLTANDMARYAQIGNGRIVAVYPACAPGSCPQAVGVQEVRS